MVLYSKQKQLGILIQMIWLFTPEAYEFPQESLSLCMESGQGELTSKHNRSLSAKHCSFPALTRIFPESNLKSRWTIPLFRRRRRRLRTLLFQENPLTNIYMHWDSYWTILTWIRTNLWQPPALPWDVSFHCAYVNWIRFVSKHVKSQSTEQWEPDHSRAEAVHLPDTSSRKLMKPNHVWDLKYLHRDSSTPVSLAAADRTKLLAAGQPGSLQRSLQMRIKYFYFATQWQRSRTGQRYKTLRGLRLCVNLGFIYSLTSVLAVVSFWGAGSICG